MPLDTTTLAGLGVIGFLALAWLLPLLRSFIRAAVLAVVIAILGVMISAHLFSNRVSLPFLGWF